MKEIEDIELGEIAYKSYVDTYNKGAIVRAENIDFKNLPLNFQIAWIAAAKAVEARIKEFGFAVIYEHGDIVEKV